MTGPCKATTRRGTACGARALAGSTLCRLHAPTPTPELDPPRWDQVQSGAMHRSLAVPGATATDERWVTLRSVRICNSDAYLVTIVDGRNVVTDWRSLTLTPDLNRARTAANRLYDRIKEN